jgi:hypothetical protein
MLTAVCATSCFSIPSSKRGAKIVFSSFFIPSSAKASSTPSFAGSSKNARSSLLRPMNAGTSSALAKNAFRRASSFQFARVSSTGSRGVLPIERRHAIVARTQPLSLF